MIERYVNDSALNSKEDFLLVPVPANETEFNDGFVGQVMREYPLAEARLLEKHGLEVGEAILVGTLGGDMEWRPVHTLVIAGIHRRQESGWKYAPQMLANVLDWLEEQHTDKSLATAGIPGTGFSGLRGDAKPEEIKRVLSHSHMRVSIYQTGLAGDRAAVLYTSPEDQDQVELDNAISSM